MNWLVILLLAGCFIEFSITKYMRRSASSKVLSRKRRFVTFPEGSSFSCAVCLTVGVMGQPSPSNFPGTFVLAVNWAIAYELPNITETLSYYHSKHRLKNKPMAMRKNRRDLYEKIEIILDKMGYDGRECILRTLCETTQRMVPHGDNMLEEMFRILFTLPITKVIPTEPLEHQIYDSAHRLGRILESCDQFKCPLSLVDLAQGYYNAPSPNADDFSKPWTLFSSSFNDV